MLLLLRMAIDRLLMGLPFHYDPFFLALLKYLTNPHQLFTLNLKVSSNFSVGHLIGRFTNLDMHIVMSSNSYEFRNSLIV